MKVKSESEKWKWKVKSESEKWKWEVKVKSEGESEKWKVKSESEKCKWKVKVKSDSESAKKVDPNILIHTICWFLIGKMLIMKMYWKANMFDIVKVKVKSKHLF